MSDKVYIVGFGLLYLFAVRAMLSDVGYALRHQYLERGRGSKVRNRITPESEPFLFWWYTWGRAGVVGLGGLMYLFIAVSVLT